MKISKDSRTRVYELTYLVPASLTADEIKQAITGVVEAISKYKGKILSSEDWGKRELSYGIKSQGKMQQEAIYTHLTIELDASVTQAFEKDIYLMPEVMRHLLVVAEETSNDEVDEAVQDKQSSETDNDKEKIDEKDKK